MEVPVNLSGPAEPSHLTSEEFRFNDKAMYQKAAERVGMKGDTSEQRRLTEVRAMVVRDSLTLNFHDTRLKTVELGRTPGQNAALDVLIYPVGVTSPVARNQAAGERP